MSVTEELTRNVLGCRFENFGQEVIDHAKNRIINVVGNMIGGAKAEGCSMLIDLVEGWGGKEESTILLRSRKVPAHNAAMVNSVMARSYDFEICAPLVDGKLYPGHVGATTVPTAIAMAEMNASNGKELITALILGDDLACRLIGTTQAQNAFKFKLGWISWGTVAMFGATAVAGRLMGLDERQLQNAFGIVLNQVAGSQQGVLDGVLSWKLPQGLASRAGIFSAELARKGFTGVKEPLLSKHGYFSLYCYPDPNLEMLTKELGKKFYSESMFKAYPCCLGVHGGIECSLQLVSKYQFAPEEIEEVLVKVTPLRKGNFITLPFEIGEFPQALAFTNLRFNVANILLRKSVSLEHYGDEAIRDPRIADLVKKVKIEATLSEEKHSHAMAVKVRMKDGREFFAETEMPKAVAAQGRFTREEIREHFRANVAFSKSVSQKKAEQALTLLEKLEEIKNIKQIIQCLTG